MFNKNGNYNLNDVDLNNLNFINKENNNNDSTPNNNSKNDTAIINDMMDLNDQFNFIMKKRIKGLEKISDSYKKGNYEESMAEAGLSKDLGVVNDFFRYALIKKDLNKIS